MMRLTSCCCGCSLRTGTLIILWLDLLGNVSNIANLIVSVAQPDVQLTFFHSSWIMWQLVSLVAVIYAIAGVEKHRPSYMLPYIGLYIASLVFLIIGLVIVWIGSIALRDNILEMYAARFKTQMSSSFSGETTKDDHTSGDIRDKFNERYSALVSIVTIYLVIAFAFSYYFLSVIYSYYKQMQDEDKGIFHRGTGIVYATTAVAPKNGFNDCPPAYEQQPAFYTPQNTRILPNASYQVQSGQYPQQFPVYPPLADQKQ